MQARVDEIDGLLESQQLYHMITSERLLFTCDGRCQQFRIRTYRSGQISHIQSLEKTDNSIVGF